MLCSIHHKVHKLQGITNCHMPEYALSQVTQAAGGLQTCVFASSHADAPIPQSQSITTYEEALGRANGEPIQGTCLDAHLHGSSQAHAIASHCALLSIERQHCPDSSQCF